MPETILIVEEDPTQLRATEYVVGQKLHHRAIAASNAEEGIRWILSGRQPQPDLLLLDLTVSEAGGLQMMRALRAYRPQLPIIVLTRYGEEVSAAQAVQAGADDFLTKPIMLERLKFSIQNALKLQRMSQYIGCLERTANGHAAFSDMVCESQNMQQVLARAQQAASSKMPIWIEGERGTGKELLARAIHGGSDRAGKPFVVFDGKAQSDEQAQAMLLGQLQTGGAHFTLGKLREAEGGTLLIKNIGMLSMLIQRRLLAVMEEGRVTPLGAPSPVVVDVRIICSTSDMATSLLAQDRLSHMLYSRLSSVSISMPPLRERRGDIALLARNFVRRFAASEHRNVNGLSEQAVQALSAGSWPGNVRQLSNLLWRAVILCDRDTLGAEELRMAQKSPHAGYADRYGDSAMTAMPVLLDMQGRLKKLKSIEEEVIRFALRYSGGCMTRAARSLGIGRSTLYRRVSELGVDGYVSRANQTTRPMIMASSAVRS